MHTALVSGWAGCMLIYELVIYDLTDPVLNPFWRQGFFVMPYSSRIGVNFSLYFWSVGLSSTSYFNFWNFESVVFCHIILSGIFVISSSWHWSYWDLEVFLGFSFYQILDLSRIFGIHLFLSSVLCFCFGYCHLSGYFGPGFWTSDSYSILGSVRIVKSSYSLYFLYINSYGFVIAHHVISGVLGILLGLWHILTRPSYFLYRLSSMGSLEVVLSTSIVSVFVISIVVSLSLWYGLSCFSVELIGFTRYSWDSGYYTQEVDRLVNRASDSVYCWEQIPDKLVFYDYIGTNPSKGGLFRSGPMIKGDGISQCWVGHTYFEIGSTPIVVRRMPAFFETFPLILTDRSGFIRADVPFRRSESSYSLEQKKVLLYILGGVLSGELYSSTPLVKSYARKSQFGEVFSFDRLTVGSDGVFRTSSRAWFSFSHLILGIFFWYGHLWHSARGLYRDVWTGVSVDFIFLVEYGLNEKLGYSII